MRDRKNSPYDRKNYPRDSSYCHGDSFPFAEANRDKPHAIAQSNLP